MDVLVLWRNGSKNVVSSSELKSREPSKKIKIGSEVEMFYKNKWYKGKVIDVENQTESDSTDDISLAKLAKKLKKDDIASHSSDDEITLEMLARKYRGQTDIVDGELKKGNILINSEF